MNKPSIIFLSVKDPHTTLAWSGIPYSMYNALGVYYNIEVIKGPQFSKLRILGNYISRSISKYLRIKYVFDYGLLMSLCYGFYYSIKLKGKANYKFIFCPAGLTELAFVRTSIPIISVGDCSILQLIDYYPSLNNVTAMSRLEMKWIESRALRKVRIQVFSSLWATNFVNKLYRPGTLLTIPFGANTQADFHEKDWNSSGLKIVFIGVDWKRKGGDDLLAIFEGIRAHRQASLTIIGCTPPEDKPITKDVEVIPNLNHLIPSDHKKLIEIMKDAQLMILPTYADCTPIVIAEAFAFGLPVIAYDTGGVGSMIRHHETGFLVPLGNWKKCTEYALMVATDRDLYKRLSLNCRRKFEEIFNWNNWGREIDQAVNKYL